MLFRSGAILFILFDLETAFLFPWAVSLKELGLFGFLIQSFCLGVSVPEITPPFKSFTSSGISGSIK